jgi:hypothetical protein
MRGRAQAVLFSAVWVAVALTGAEARGQQTDDWPKALSGVAGASAAGPRNSPPVPTSPPPSNTAFPPPKPPPPDQDTLFTPPDPGQNGWGPYGESSPPPGFFCDVDLQIIRPVLLNRIINDTPLANGAFLQVPSADLNWTVAPRFEAGYRLPESWGFVAAGYRFWSSDGSGTVPPGEGGLVSAVHTRAALNMADIDYGTTPYAFTPRWDWSWRVGVRYGDVFFESRAVNDAFNQESSDFFTGFGPHARLDLQRHVPEVPGLALWTRFDGSVLLGRISQKFRDTEFAPDGTPAFSAFEQNSTQAVPTLLIQAGLAYTPPGRDNLHFNFGYVYERWWYVGQVGLTATSGAAASRSHGEVGSQGVSLRAQVDF